MPDSLVEEQPKDRHKVDVKLGQLEEDVKPVNLVEGDWKQEAEQGNADYKDNEIVCSTNEVDNDFYNTPKVLLSVSVVMDDPSPTFFYQFYRRVFFPAQL